MYYLGNHFIVGDDLNTLGIQVSPPKEIRELLREKRNIRRKWQRTRSMRDKNKYNNLAWRLKREIKNYTKSQIAVVLTEMTSYSSKNN